MAPAFGAELPISLIALRAPIRERARTEIERLMRAFERRKVAGIDTGAAMGGRLTCLVLEGEGMRFLTA